MSSDSTEKLQTEKLQKVLARAGLGSRRQIETWIQQERVQVNRCTATLGDRVSITDDIYVDKRKISPSILQASPQQVLCYHKPTGVVCTRHDPENRPTVFKRLSPPSQGRWISIGRLDFNTAGLLLLTTDGELAHRLMHPSYTIEREYAVRILGEVDDAMLKRLSEGVELDDGMARFKRLLDAGGTGINHWYHVILNEGRKHEVRRLWESQGVKVSRLIRIRFGPILLPPGLLRGHHVELDSKGLRELLQIVDLKTHRPPTDSTRQSPTQSPPKIRIPIKSPLKRRKREYTEQSPLKRRTPIKSPSFKRPKRG
jgi:23S rRNA pseudouridine2605 synthase